MLGFTRDSGPLTPLAKRSPAAFAAVGFLVGLLGGAGMVASSPPPHGPWGWRIATMTAMGLAMAFVGWYVAQRVRSKSKSGS